MRKHQKNPDRIPPSSAEAERAVLGCILLAPGDCLIECAERWGDTPVFFNLQHQLIYDACQRLHAQSKVVDLVTVHEALRADGKIDQAGGTGFLNLFVEAAGHPSSVTEYADILWSHYQRRQAIRVATEIAIAAYETEGSADELLTRFEERVFGLPRARERGSRPIGQYCQVVIEKIESYSRGKGTITGLPTGFAYWDKLAAGLQNTELIVIGGRPGTGKTSLAMNVVERVAMGREPQAVGVMSMEMSAIDLTTRLACSRARVNFHKLRTGCASESDLDRLPAALLEIKRAPIHIDQETGLTVFDIRSRLRAMRQRYGIRLAIVDYLQLTSLPPQYVGDPVRGYGEVAKGLMASAKELEIPIIVLSQLSREGEKRGDRPKMSDLRESGDIEACAHFIGILYRRKLAQADEAALRAAIESDPMGNHSLPMLMEVCKNRNGPSGTAMQFTFLRWCMRFEDLQHETPEPGLPQTELTLDETDAADLAAWSDRQGGHGNGNGNGHGAAPGEDV